MSKAVVALLFLVLAQSVAVDAADRIFRGFPASVRALKEKPHQIKRVIKASRYIRQNREGTLPVMIKWLKIDRDIASMTYDSVWKAFTEDGSLPKNGVR